MSDHATPKSGHANLRPTTDAPGVPESFLLTSEDLFSVPPISREGEASKPKKKKLFRSRVPLPVAPSDSQGGPPKVWATVNVERLLAFSERYQPELLAPAALRSWFRILGSQPLLASYKERGDRAAILALGFASGNRADPFFDLPADPIAVSLEPSVQRGQTRAASLPHVRLRFPSECDIWIRSRREVILVAPSSPSESLRACRLFVEFGSLDASGHMTYTFRPATYEILTPDQAIQRPMVHIRRAA